LILKSTSYDSGTFCGAESGAKFAGHRPIAEIDRIFWCRLIKGLRAAA
jgi:hypothetical protein